MIQITDIVQNKACDSTDHPSKSRIVSAIGVKLRLRLSKIFQRDSVERGFFLK